MGDINQVLSQEDIDNLVSKNASKKPPVPHATISVKAEAMKTIDDVSIPTLEDTPKVKQQNPAPAPRPVNQEPPAASGHHEECIAAGEIQSLSRQITALSSRLAKIENSILKLDKKAQSPNEVSASQMKTAIQQMKNVSSQVEIITEGLRGTAGYNLNKTFKCSSCKSSGVVAIKVKCTQCGQENWWGWWPKKK
jgi:hypothetical protein